MQKYHLTRDLNVSKITLSYSKQNELEQVTHITQIILKKPLTLSEQNFSNGINNRQYKSSFK